MKARLSILGGELELVARNSAELKKTNQSFLDQVIRTRRAGGDSDNRRSGRQPEMGNDFAFLVQIVMLDLVLRHQPRRVEHEISRQLFLAHFGEVRRV